MSSNPCILDDAILPKKLTDSGQEEGQEVEAFDGQWIYLLPVSIEKMRIRNRWCNDWSIGENVSTSTDVTESNDNTDA